MIRAILCAVDTLAHELRVETWDANGVKSRKGNNGKELNVAILHPMPKRGDIDNT